MSAAIVPFRSRAPRPLAPSDTELTDGVKDVLRDLASRARELAGDSDSSFIRTMRELERVSPDCAETLLLVAEGMFEELLGVPFRAPRDSERQ